ncbi:hypothetical protein [Caenibius sp. WL]|uniref:hypothetical protein n=1 Tax=Caenibius sp. WL TaxID=2872646 RepID=UPI001C99E1A0|nr:hypothetical protein [Caenibius sp. WL]QZP06840.1 hypothetical protein K5X80_08870 [Caenibius sp. WL]
MPGGDLYTLAGKQVLCGGEHYADAANELAAEIIVGALNCDGSGIVSVLRRNEAETVAADMRAKLPTLTGAKGLPLRDDDPAWADVVQHIVRRAAEVVGARGQS